MSLKDWRTPHRSTSPVELVMDLALTATSDRRNHLTPITRK